MIEKLKKCPFCGGEAVLKQFDIEDGTIDTYYPEEIEDELDSKIDTYPKCKECGCELGVYETAEKAIEAWNTRKPMERIVERLEWMEGNCVKKPGEKEYGKYRGYRNAIEIVKEEGGLE